MHYKILLLPALFLGMIIGPLVVESYGILRRSETVDPLDYVGVLVSVLAAFAILTFWVFRVRTRTFGLSPDQLRLAWVGAYLLGALGMPLVYRMVNLVSAGVFLFNPNPIPTMPRSLYSPRLSDDVVRRLYREGLRRKMPMTRLADSLLREALAGVPMHCVVAGNVIPYPEPRDPDAA